MNILNVNGKSLLVAILSISSDRSKKKECYFIKSMQVETKSRYNLHAIEIYWEGLQTRFRHHLSVEQINGTSCKTGIVLGVCYHYDGGSFFIQFA